MTFANKLIKGSGVGIAIKSKKTSSKLAICQSYKYDFSLVGSYIRAFINKTHSLANLQDLIHTLAGIIISSTNQPK